MNTYIKNIFILLLTIISMVSYAQNQPNPQNAPVTPTENNINDLETTRSIRNAIMGSSTLSTPARDIQVRTINGAVTLTGLVRSEAEAQAVLQMARETTSLPIYRQLTVSPQ